MKSEGYGVTDRAWRGRGRAKQVSLSCPDKEVTETVSKLEPGLGSPTRPQKLEPGSGLSSRPKPWSKWGPKVIDLYCSV